MHLCTVKMHGLRYAVDEFVCRNSNGMKRAQSTSMSWFANGALAMLVMFIPGCGSNPPVGGDPMETSATNVTAVDSPQVDTLLQRLLERGPNGLMLNYENDTAYGLFYAPNNKRNMEFIHILSAAPPSTDPPVPETEWRALLDTFDQQFGSMVGGVFTPFAVKEVTTSWRAFEDTVLRLNPGANQIRGVLFHYGFDAVNRHFKVGFSVVPMTYFPATQEYKYDTVGTAFYKINATGGIVRSKLHLWNNGEKARYFAHVKLKRVVGGSVGDLGGGDTESYMQAYEDEILRLGADNLAQITSQTKLVIACIAEDARDSQGNCKFRHHIALNLRNGAVNLVDDTTYPGQRFRMKAADLGTPCPPRCKKFKFDDKSLLCLP